jgi:hypothetical protein
LPDKTENRIIVTSFAVDKKQGFVQVIKPFSGIYGLEEKAKLIVPKKTGFFVLKKTKISSVKNLRFWNQLWHLCKLFWNPIWTLYQSRDKVKEQKDNNQSSNNNQSSRHGANNKILSISNLLIDRSHRILNNTSDCQSAIHGAVLALEAKELLNNLSMTTSLEAIALQHQCEVKAECSFYGVAHEIEIDQRLDALANEIDVAIRNDESPTKLAQSYNAQIEIVNNICRIFREYEQFDEEDKCLDKVRRFRQGLHFFGNKKFLSIFALLVILVLTITSIVCGWAELQFWLLATSPFLLVALSSERYFNWLVKSGLNIIKAVLVWVVFFAFALYPIYLHAYHNFELIRVWDSGFLSCWWGNFYIYLEESALTIFELQPAGVIDTFLGAEYTKHWIFNLIIFEEVLIGWLHLGIFISYFYQKISRR